VTILARDDDPPTGPSDEERQAFEKASRAIVRKMFDAVLRDQWATVFDLHREARSQGDWFAVAVWSALPGTLKDKLWDMDNDARRTDRTQSIRDPDLPREQ
jgi:hypothetical protein